ncbi:hypothetical protein [Carboxylicivirga caseinilyticus]|uniref:hypothetical protein n=1 Tax=Carboxylicivirga caseinilyticus TaxID=3417572 RepID=UPI003D34ADB5|nr:hypothetical protein [Marinilabiliaceae bacterium A049]
MNRTQRRIWMLSVGVLLLYSFAFTIEADCQTVKAQIKITKGEKLTYALSDVISLEGQVQLPTEICEDGMGNTKLFLSGLELLKDEGWQRDTCNYWIRKIDVKVIGNKKGISKITLMRKADKGEFFTQLKLKTDDTGNQ